MTQFAAGYVLGVLTGWLVTTAAWTTAFDRVARWRRTGDPTPAKPARAAPRTAATPEEAAARAISADAVARGVEDLRARYRAANRPVPSQAVLEREARALVEAAMAGEIGGPRGG